MALKWQANAPYLELLAGVSKASSVFCASVASYSSDIENGLEGLGWCLP
jgi:hypothetical protein